MYRQKENCETSIMQDSVIVIDNDNKSLHVLNETAALIWNCICEKTVEEIAMIISDNYSNINKCEVIEDIKCTINELISKGLIQESIEAYDGKD